MLTLSPPQAAPLVDRVLGRLRGSAPGPTLICVAGLHGNEPAGVTALRRAVARLRPAASALAGDLLGLTGNRKALATGSRYLDDDLNRIWQPERLARVRAGAAPERAEDEEMRALDRELEGAFAAARGPVFALDLHTTSAPGPPFAVLDDTLANRAFARHFPVPLVVGLEEELDGPLLHHLLARGAVTLAFESGRHDEPAAVERAEAALWLALEAAGLLPTGLSPEVAAARRLLAAAAAGLPAVVEVRYRQPIAAGDGFAMLPGFAGFQSVRKGEVVARDRQGPVAVRERGRLLMPLYQALGAEGFFLVRPINPAWLAASAVLRRLRLERFLHRLPGVCPHPTLPQTFVVDRRVARWLVRELFHLLGFRRLRGAGDALVFSRRSDGGERASLRRR